MMKLLPTKKSQIGFTFVSKRRRSRQRGFTLIELLIVIAIIVIIIAIAAVSYTTVQKNSRNSKRQSDLQKQATALEEYYTDKGHYPVTNYGNFETAGNYIGGAVTPSGDDSFGCLFGDPWASNINFWHVTNGFTAPCDQPLNTYINVTVDTNGDRLGNPFDPSFSGLHYYSAYKYASNGQSYVLVTDNYEGTAPSQNLFTCTNDPFYWHKGSGYPNVFSGKQLVVRSPAKPPSATCP